ncbi:MAG: PAS domain S-box protein, partial [Sulfuritalea sp.]|nr:PAS domain S-box protein [Sulfuritalea sp.]
MTKKAAVIEAHVMAPQAPLRAMAEVRFARASAATHPERSPEELLHELQVYQVELEMQNEALRQSQLDLAASRDRYADLYEFAPVGYLTLNPDGMISEVNLTAAAILGIERKQLLQRRFTAFVSPVDRNRWMLHFLNLKRSGSRAAIELLVGHGDGRIFAARLDCSPSGLLRELIGGESVADSALGKVGADEAPAQQGGRASYALLAAADGGTAIHHAEVGNGIRIALTDINETAKATQGDRNFHAIFERSPIAIAIAGPDRRYQQVNAAMCKMLGYSEAELLGMKFTDITHPDDVKLNVWNVEGLESGEAGHFSMEKRYIRKNGETLWVSLNVVEVKDTSGRTAYTVGLAEDITERRETELKRLAEARQQRETLVREVHHRIKNNLQGVAGLLQRELGKFVELNPRLEAAISQIHAIATVHGLQGEDAGEAVRLCESISSICKTVSDLSQRPVLFSIKDEHTTFKPVQIDTLEAVPVALVLNELILNAVKHSPEGAAAPTVRLSADGSRASVVIRNACGAESCADIDLDRGQGLGTGLRLVRSLLPTEGAKLSHE